jgi:uncharacterized repeat protein (TIGR03943 family)
MIDRLIRQISFFAPAAVMSAWATVMLYTVASGHINRLLSPMFRSYVIIAAVVLFLLSALHLFLYQPESPSTPITPVSSRLRPLGRWLVLLLPLLAASVLSPSALSSTTLTNRSLDPTAGVTAMPSMSDKTNEEIKTAEVADPNQPAPMEVTDLITLSRSPEHMKSFVGRKVRTVGMVVNQGGSPKLVRWIMWCCAADAQPASVELAGDISTVGKETAPKWYEVVGTAQFPSTLGHIVPQIEIETLKPAPEPDEPYLSP